MLNSTRTATEAGSNPITLTEIQAYFDIFRLKDVEERKCFVRFIKALDRVYLKHCHEKQKKALSNIGKGGGGVNTGVKSHGSRRNNHHKHRR